MNTVKTYTILASSPLINGSVMKEVVCEGYEPEKARKKARQRLDEEFGGNYWSMKMARQFQPQSTEYNYYAVTGVELSGLDPGKLKFERIPEICAPIQAEMGWEDAYVDIVNNVCIVLPKSLEEACTEKGLYGIDDYKNDTKI